MENVMRCFLCCKKYINNNSHKAIDSTLCPSSKKTLRHVLLHLARCGKFDLLLSRGELLCRQCYVQIIDYDATVVSMSKKQKTLTALVEKAVTSIDSDVEEECLQDIQIMEEFNNEHFFEDIDVSDSEIAETIFEVVRDDASRPPNKRSAKNQRKKTHFDTPSSQHNQAESEPKDRIQCNMCAMRFYSKDRLYKHIVNVHKKFSCELCSYSHRNEDYVMLHMNIHEGKNENSCRYCDKEFTTKISTLRHMEVHLDTKKYQCDKCGVCFSQTTSLYNHKLLHEAEEKPLCCEVCNQMFKTKRTFRHHMVTHQADRPRYSCEFCDKTFTEKYTLKVHKRTHPEAGTLPTKQEQQQVEPMEQQSDDYEYTIISSQTTTNASQAANAKFSCIICDHQFTNKEHLNKHMEVSHDVILKSIDVPNFSQCEVVTSDSRKSCHICGQTFRTQNNIDLHFELVHGLSFK